MHERGAVTLRPAGADDCWSLWEWRNEEGARQASFDPRPILREEHASWFARRLADLAETIFIASAQGREIGYVRFDVVVDGDEARVSVALAPDARGHGYGPEAISAGVRAFTARRPGCRVTALIREDNHRSEAAFRHAGFVPAQDDAVACVAGARCSLMEWPGDA